MEQHCSDGWVASLRNLSFDTPAINFVNIDFCSESIENMMDPNRGHMNKGELHMTNG